MPGLVEITVLKAVRISLIHTAAYNCAGVGENGQVKTMLFQLVCLNDSPGPGFS